MRKKLGDFFEREARKIDMGARNIVVRDMKTERVLQFIMNRVAVIYYEGKADGLEEAREVIHLLKGEEVKDGNI